MPDTPPDPSPFQARRIPDLIDDHAADGIFANWVAHLDVGRFGHPASAPPSPPGAMPPPRSPRYMPATRATAGCGDSDKPAR